MEPWIPRRILTDVGENRFVECEKWRKEFGTDDLVRHFEFPEKSQVFEYYPQYYHKTDKVGFFFPEIDLSFPVTYTQHTLNGFSITI
jgi:hypothetical protein